MIETFAYLETLWKSAPGSGRTDPQALLDAVIAAERRVRRATLLVRLAASALLVGGLVFFIVVSTRATTDMVRGAYLVQAVVYAWLLFFPWIWLHRSAEPDPSGTLSAHARLLSARYERIAELLRAAVWWGLIPLWASFAFVAFAYVIAPDASPRRPLVLAMVFGVFSVIFFALALLIRRTARSLVATKREALDALVLGTTGMRGTER